VHLVGDPHAVAVQEIHADKTVTNPPPGEAPLPLR